MRPAHAPRLVLVLILVCASGCMSENKGKIEGKKWRSQASVVKGISVPDGMVWLQFKTDGGVIYRVGGQAFTGTYRLLPGKSVVMNLDRAVAGRKTHTESIEIRGDRLTMTDTDGTQLTFYEEK